jgi:maltose O-acetyltransferase
MDTLGPDTHNQPLPMKGIERETGTFLRVIREELNQFHIRLLLLDILFAPLPLYVGGRVRSWLLRTTGFKIGHGTLIWGSPSISGNHNMYQHLSIGEFCAINIGCFFDLGADITIGNHVSIGHQVMILTTSHKLGPAERRAGELTTSPVRIENGAWLGARSTILPGVTIGAGAIVSAGSVVNKDVPPNTIAAGSPARIVVPKIR